MLAPCGFQQLTGITTSTALTVPAQASHAILQAETQNVRWRDDGTPPTASVGNLIRTTDPPYMLDGLDLTAIRVIAASAGAILNVSYYRPRNFTVSS